jgi:hypothetical protein
LPDRCRDDQKKNVVAVTKLANSTTQKSVRLVRKFDASGSVYTCPKCWRRLKHLSRWRQFQCHSQAGQDLSNDTIAPFSTSVFLARRQAMQPKSSRQGADSVAPNQQPEGARFKLTLILINAPGGCMSRNLVDVYTQSFHDRAISFEKYGRFVSLPPGQKPRQHGENRKFCGI